jgi:DNA-binding NarL/FixJ family response regulator
MPLPTVLLADDHPVVAEGLASLLRSQFSVVGVVTDGAELLAAARRFQPDVIVTDLSMPAMSGLEVLRRLRADGPTSKVVLLTVHTDVELAAEAFRAGASGFIVKHAASTELVAAICSIVRGKTYVSPELAQDVLSALAESETSSRGKLTLRQREVVRLLADGRTAKEVAAALGVSPRTVEAHKYHIMEMLGLGSTAELIRYAIERGLTTPPAASR